MKSISEDVRRANRFERRLAVVRKLKEIFPDYRGVYKFVEYQFIDLENICGKN